MRQEGFGGAVGDRPARRLAAAARADPAGFHQHVEGALGHHDAADFLDLNARHRLMVGDHRQRLDRGARQLLRDHGFLGEQPRQVAGGAERPLGAELHQVDAARRVLRLQGAQRLAHVDLLRQPRAERLLVERRGRGEQQSLEQAQVLGTRLRLALLSLLSRLQFVVGDDASFRQGCHASALLRVHSIVRGAVSLETAAAWATSRLRR